MSSTTPRLAARTWTLDFPPPHPKQRDALRSRSRVVVVEAGTKAGKTTGAILWCTSAAWERPGTRWWWVAPYYRQAQIAYGRVVGMLQRARVPMRVNASRMEVSLPNGSVLEFRSGENPDALYGEDVWGCVIDEAARLREEAYHAIGTTLTATRGRLFVISTPKGKRNWFWGLCQRAKDPLEPDYEYHHLLTRDNPYISAEAVEFARAELPDAIFRELYLGEAQDDEAAVFRGVARCVDGALEAPAAGRAYLAGVDLARHEDYTVVCVLDRERRHVVAWDRWRRIDWTLQKERIAAHLKRYQAAALVDATGVGDPIVSDLRASGLRVEGYTFTTASKQQLVERLAVALEQRQVTFPALPDLLGELDAYGYEMTRTGYRYAAPEGLHDDCVMALGLAVFAATQPPPRRPTPIGWSRP